MTASTLQGWLSRAALVGLGIAAMCAGLALGSVGCSRCECGEVEPLQPGVFEIVASERPELVGGIVDASNDEAVQISFTDAQGNDLVVDYAVVGRWPE